MKYLLYSNKLAFNNQGPRRIRQTKHFPKNAHRLVGLGGLVPHLEAQFRHMRTLHGREHEMAEFGHDVAIHRAPERLDRLEPTVHLDMRD